MQRYEDQASTLTLAEGIAEYYRDNPGLVRGTQLSVAAQEFFRCHDAVHVVFGCGTSLPDEAIVKMASMFGTTAGLSVLRGYRLHESIEIYKQLRVTEVLLAIALSALIIPGTIYRCLRQRKRWPWDTFSSHMDTPLNDLRAEYGIRVARFRHTGQKV